MVFDGTYIWVTDNGQGKKRRDSDGTLVVTLTAGNTPNALAFDGTKVWIVNQGGQLVSRR